MMVRYLTTQLLGKPFQRHFFKYYNFIFSPLTDKLLFLNQQKSEIFQQKNVHDARVYLCTAAYEAETLSTKLSCLIYTLHYTTAIYAKKIRHFLLVTIYFCILFLEQLSEKLMYITVYFMKSGVSLRKHVRGQGCHTPEETKFPDISLTIPWQNFKFPWHATSWNLGLFIEA